MEVKKCLDSEYLVKEEPTVFADGSVMLCVLKNQDDPFPLRHFLFFFKVGKHFFIF